MSTYPEHLLPFLPFIPSDLISAECLRKILSVTQGLPAALGVGPFMFECSLDDRPTADFSVAAFASRGDHVTLSKPNLAEIEAARFGNPGWSQILQFANSWSSVSSALNAVEEIWLEFDVCLTMGTPDNTPSVFFRLEYQSGQENELRGRSYQEYLHAAKDGLDILTGGAISSETLSLLAECLSSLPVGGRILFLGAMISRAGGPVRVVASRLDLKDLIQYLRRLGLRETIGQLALIAEISDLTDHLWLAIDLDEKGVTPRIGFDCYRENASPSEGTRQWEDFLSLLVEKGVCTDHKRTALLRAADLSVREFDEITWPQSVLKIAKLLGPTGFDRLDLSIHHIKVIDRPNLPLEAKAYLCGSYKW